jgi:hypothetical protein
MWQLFYRARWNICPCAPNGIEDACEFGRFTAAVERLEGIRLGLGVAVVMAAFGPIPPDRRSCTPASA